jgi:methionyl-tRNA formyltransferase
LDKVLVLGTDTPHRRFIINKLIDAGKNITSCLFFESTVKPKFNNESPWSYEENTVLRDRYLRETSGCLQRVSSVHHPVELTMENSIVKKFILDADFIIVSGTDRIKDELLAEIAEKSLNVHMGIAEEYRGLDSNLWAWYHQDYENIGVSLHKLAGSLDTGDLFRTGRVEVTSQTKVWELRYLESTLAVKLIIDTLDDIAAQAESLQTQRRLGRYYSFMPFDIKRNLPITAQIKPLK